MFTLKGEGEGKGEEEAVRGGESAGKHKEMRDLGW